ncbi:PREDICTED: protein CEBPZOS-like [Branchiostoma belcheri]|uniref:Protein CEBPZOS-like n=1 Tax=Branchiostoma belcheri TaxID=7741 RepID=A0A6P5AL57_BRABE|nr:PREDICTED: protein CEBPZOS-like [Branchiostoma belcheri]
MSRRLIIKTILYAELGFLGATYIVWHRMNTSQDFRHYMHQKWPSILEGFYKTGEMSGYREARIADYKAWGLPHPFEELSKKS